MTTPAKKINKKYTYADYLTWQDEERWEIIEGVPYCMSPAPGTEHQSVSFELGRQIGNFLKDKKCKAFAAPFDVIFFEKDNVDENTIETVVQPDLVIICDEKKLDKRGCKGAPDAVIEILSDSTAYKDEGEKLRLYEKYGVKEYWIVNPKARYVMIYRLDDNRYGKPVYLTEEDVLDSSVLKGLSVRLAEIWG